MGTADELNAPHADPPDCCQGAGASCTVSNERMRSVAAVKTGAAPCFDFRDKLLAAHGLSVLLTAQPAGGGRPRTVLFDAGPERQVGVGWLQLGLVVLCWRVMGRRRIV